MKALVDHDRCTGSGICKDECPIVFLVKDGLAQIEQDIIPEDQEDACRTAREDCPVEAIELEE